MEGVMHTLLVAWNFWAHAIREPLWNPYGAALSLPLAAFALHQMLTAWRKR
jgi:hypothetical protein